MGIQKVGTQKRILILIQQHTAPPLSSLHQLFRIEPRSSSNNLNQTIHHSKNASLDRIRANGKSLSPNIAPRSSSKSVTTLDRQYGIYPNELTMADTIPNVQGRIPLPMHQPSSSSASSIGEYGSNHPPWKPYASLNNDGSMAGIGKLVARPTGSHTMPAPVTGAAKQQFSQQTQFVGPMTRRGSGPNLLAPSGLQVSTTESPSSSERVIIKVQDGNQEVHRIDVTAGVDRWGCYKKADFQEISYS
ncbi:hypothetical protein BDR26DRAFT_404424 [Obelidium mucronatum]|nr:hypothetical protein BDR26DRAFT_404424 [Obelidium mucronatum]